MTQLQYTQTPVVESSGSNQNSLSALRGLAVNTNPVQSIGAVDFRSAMSLPKGLPQDITFTLENDDDTDEVIFCIGDYSGLVRAILGGSYEDPEVSSSSYAAVQKALANNPSVFSMINYRITVGNPSQFGKRFQYASANPDGTLLIQPINMGAAQRNSALNDKILTLSSPFLMSDSQALILRVAPETTVEIDLSWAQVYAPGIGA